MGDMWYVVSCTDWGPSLPEERVWTLSRCLDKPGWNTDGGCDGYGLTKSDADFLAAAANEKVARDG